jgi:transcriptional regulator with XRE-family HTH domain
MNEDAVDRVALGERLRAAREYLGFSQEEVGKYLGVPRSAVSLIESGIRRIDILELRRLAKLYQRSVAELTGEAQGQQTEPNSVMMVARAAATVSPEDRSEVLRFAEFLQSRKAAPTK